MEYVPEPSKFESDTTRNPNYKTYAVDLAGGVSAKADKAFHDENDRSMALFKVLESSEEVERHVQGWAMGPPKAIDFSGRLPEDKEARFAVPLATDPDFIKLVSEIGMDNITSRIPLHLYEYQNDGGAANHKIMIESEWEDIKPKTIIITYNGAYYAHVWFWTSNKPDHANLCGIGGFKSSVTNTLSQDQVPHRSDSILIPELIKAAVRYGRSLGKTTMIYNYEQEYLSEWTSMFQIGIASEAEFDFSRLGPGDPDEIGTMNI